MTTDQHPAFYLPQPKGYRCPACKHLTFSHREHGCDSNDCGCTAPHGRIMPADDAPTSDGDTIMLVVSDARERLARHLWIADGCNPDAWDRRHEAADQLAKQLPGQVAEFLKIYERYEERADVLLAVAAGREEQS